MSATASPARPSLAGRLWPWVVLLTLGIAWGLSFSLMRFATETGLDPIGILAWHHAIAALMILVPSLFRRGAYTGGWGLLRICVTGGLLSALIPSVVYYFAAPHVPAGVLSITITVAPIMTFLLSAMFGIEAFSLLRGLGVLLGAIAIGLLVVPEASLPDPSEVPWVLAACAAAVCYAVQNMILVRWRPDGADSAVMTAGMFGTSAVILWVYLAATGNWIMLAWPPGKLELAILGLAAISAFAYALLVYLIGHSGAVFGSQCSYIITLAGVGWGILLFGEAHSGWIWLSLAVMLLGLALVQPRHRASPRQMEPQRAST